MGFDDGRIHPDECLAFDHLGTRRMRRPSRDEFVGGSHYDVEIDGRVVECMQIIDALGMSFRIASAFKYIWRSARGKPGEPRDRDLKKAENMIHREITGQWSCFGKSISLQGLQTCGTCGQSVQDKKPV